MHFSIILDVFLLNFQQVSYNLDCGGGGCGGRSDIPWIVENANKLDKYRVQAASILYLKVVFIAPLPVISNHINSNIII